jgi:nucleoside-diphosphate-sugar epimerase
LSLVTGAAGFVGKALVRRLVAEGGPVRAVVLPGDPQLPVLGELSEDREALEIIEADVTDERAISRAMEDVEHVFHTAALVHEWSPWERYRAVNVRGTQTVTRAAEANGVGRLVHISTTDVFGIPRAQEDMNEDSPFREWGEPYPDTKIQAERWLWRFQRDSPLPVTIIYPGWVYGPGDRAFFPGLARAITGRFMVFWYQGPRLPWVYIENLVDACILASRFADAIGHGYIIHDGTDGPTLEEVCSRIAGVCNARAPTRHVPYVLALAAAHTLQTLWRILNLKGTPPLLTVDVKSFGRQWRLSNDKARFHLRWEPRVSVEDGMSRALDWLASQELGASGNLDD